MASVFALRALLGASLGLGALDLVWINVSLAPRLVERGEPARATAALATTPDVEPALELASSHAIEREVPALALPSVTPPELAPAVEGVAEPEPEPEAVVEPVVHPVVHPVVATRDERVYFATGSAVLGDKARRVLRSLVESAPPDATFALEGHADYRGREAFNLSLSRRRAIAVARYLEKLGIEAARVRVSFVGEDPSAGERELWRDRRVDIQISGGS